MEYTWDDAKAQLNLDKHGLAFVKADQRFDYGGHRYCAYGLLYGRIAVLVSTMRGDTCRIILLRKANSREVKRYDQQCE